MDKIIMKNMVFYGYHGVLEEEKILGQKFHIDAELYSDLKQAGQTDDLNHTINYAMVYEIIKNTVTENKYDLLEALAHKICEGIIISFEKIRTVKLTIKKPNAPVAGNFDYFAVQIKRSRNDYE